MSLYVGHLPPNARPEDLQRVFRRFGRCNVQLKDGYGFVIYDATADAENALRSMQGKIVCGERVSINWSNKQPRPFPILERRAKFYEPYHRRSFKEEFNGVGIRGFHERRNFSGSTSYRAPARNDVLEKEAGHENIDEVGRGKGVSLKEGAMDKGGQSEVNPVENDRWGEPASDSLTGRELENGSDNDHYEPYRGHSRRSSSSGSHKQGSSWDKGRREHSIDDNERKLDNSKPQLSCYNCGLVGHVIRNCPHGDARRDKFSRFNRRREKQTFRDRDEGRVKRLRSDSLERINSSRDPFKSDHRSRNRDESIFKKSRRDNKSEIFPDGSDKSRPKARIKSLGKKKKKLERGTKKKVLKRRTGWRSGISSPSSDSSTASSKSDFKSPASDTSFSSHSRSPSSRSRSASSSSRFVSVPSRSKYSSSRSRSKSKPRSRSSLLRSLSLSVSLDPETPSSPKDAPINIPRRSSPNGKQEDIPSPESKRPLFINNLEKTESNDIFPASKDDNTLTELKVDRKTNEEYLANDDDNARQDAYKIEEEKINLYMDVLDEVGVTSDNEGEHNESVKTNMQGPVSSKKDCSMVISPKELLMALRHYGVPISEEGNSSMFVEEYFGAARVWPWEMIYYRRLKKGPISTENYARRLEQNRQFGIIDKYIRSSSGWGECHQDDA